MPRVFVICCLMLMIMPVFAQQNVPLNTKVMVRRYENIEGNPEAYEGIQADMPVETMSIDPSKLTGSGLLVLTAADQTDAEFAKTIGGGFYSLPFKNGKAIPKIGPPTNAVTLTHFGMRRAINAQAITVLDALGNPIPGATVEPIAFKYEKLQSSLDKKPAGPLLGRFKTDDKGIVELPWPVGECDRYYFTVSHENYGATHIAVLSFRMPVKVGLVPADGPARERALNGRVLLPDGSPAAGALILVNDVRAPGSGPTMTGGFCVVAGPDGRFSGYPNHKDSHQNMGELIPSGSTYFFRVKYPVDPRQPVMCFNRANGAETEIKLERGNKLRRFAFEDEHGLITDPQLLQSIVVMHEASDERSKVGYKWSEAVQDHWFLPGKYSAAVYSPTTMGRQTATFQPVTIDAASPDLVVFRSGAQTVFEGRVIDALTNRPMPGAVVYAVTSHLSQATRERLDNLTREEWAAIHKLPPDPKQDDPALAPLKRIDDFAHMVRTGSDGRYRLAVAPGTPVRWILGAEENYIGVRQILQGKPEGSVAVDDLKIFPAATVTFRIVNKRERNLHLVPVWLVERAGLSSLASDYFFPKQGRPNMQFEYFEMMPTNADIPVTSYTLHVPAGVKLGVAMSPTNDQWRPIKLAAAISLAQGESRDLGEFAVKASAIAPVQVVGPDGLPIEGAPMYRGWSKVHNTDAQGVAYFFIEPGTKGEFELRVQQNDKTVLSAKVPFDCPENVTDLPMLTINLTAEQVAIVNEALKLKPVDQVTTGTLANPAAAPITESRP